MLTKSDIEKYFLAEKQGALLVLIIGGIAILIGLIFFVAFRTGLFRGAAIPLLVLGIMECFVGYGIYKRSDEERIKLVYAYDMNPSLLKTEELPRMQELNKRFRIYQAVEIGFVLVGIILMILYNGRTERSFWVGFGLTLVIQGVSLFGIETMATQRAKEYTRKLSGYLAAWPQR
ncbi:MAG: hypothetical protein J7578_15185 [Chitinophagaceae bacterium]|nr:hypothetical protein [Chitinophagaceae bacterium]